MDKYTVIKCSNGNGSLFFFKNGKLHREAGPAVVTASNREQFTNLGDENLYQEKIIQSDFPENYEAESVSQIYIHNIFGGYAITCSTAVFYLDGQPYNSEDFEKKKQTLMLKNELSQELPTLDNISKKVKI